MRGERRLLSGTKRTSLFSALRRTLLMVVRCTGVPIGSHECHPSQTWRWSTSASNRLMFPVQPGPRFPSLSHTHVLNGNSAAVPSRPWQNNQPKLYLLAGRWVPSAASDPWNRKGMLWEKWQWWAKAVLYLGPRYIRGQQVESPNKGLQRPRLNFQDSSGPQKPSFSSTEQ